MRYKRVQAASLQSNSVRNLVLRQQFAMEFLRQWQLGKRIINFDKTWLSMTNFLHQKWRPPGAPNTVPKAQVSPRISMIAALDSCGAVFISLVQANTNACIMRIFLRNLAKNLEADDRHWHRNTVLLCDNATYHTCSSTLKVYEELGAAVLFTGPHSYSASPIELFFAAFKRRDINPGRLPVGKKVSPSTK
jgi:hypothetical protein